MVVTASGFQQKIEDSAASISVITREQLEKRAYRDVTDALKDVPGVVVTGGGSSSDISIRGMGSKYTLMLVDGKKQNKLMGVSQEQILRMEREMANLQGQYKLVEQTYGQDVLNLVLARGYLSKMVENESVVKYLRQWQSEVLEQFESIVATTSLEL